MSAAVASPAAELSLKTPPPLPTAKPKQKVQKQAQLKQKHDGNCICAVCECGRHKLCQPVRVSEGKLDGHTEYHDNYLKYGVGKPPKGKPNLQNLAVGGDFYGSTENREKYTPHTLPHTQPIRKAQAYAPNPGQFTSITTQRHDYPAWPGVRPPTKKERPVWVSTSGAFEGATTTRESYKTPKVPPGTGGRVRRNVEWVKPDTVFDASSTNKHDYRLWPTPPRPKGRMAPPYTAGVDDRDFKSTTGATYTQHDIPKTVSAKRPVTVPAPTRFEGTTTTQEAFRKWDVAPPPRREKAAYTPSGDKFDGHTTYNNTYTPKALPPHTLQKPSYTFTPTPFSGTSTHRTDFTPLPYSRPKDFRPNLAYVPVNDDRDFLSTMRKEHTPKSAPVCPAREWMEEGVDRVRGRDGHVYLGEVEREVGERGREVWVEA
ncbi:hypothetical protein HDV00_001214 [Rhizophlyctis rosea]|nr:hypothetical protein HDV00_001214 [Rhizophlyctis rosea]